MRALAATTDAASRTVAQLEQVRSARAAYISDLAHRRALDATRIAEITSAAAAAEAKTQTIAPPAEVMTADVSLNVAAPLTTAAGGRTLTVVATEIGRAHV